MVDFPYTFPIEWWFPQELPSTFYIPLHDSKQLSSTCWIATPETFPYTFPFVLQGALEEADLSSTFYIPIPTYKDLSSTFAIGAGVANLPSKFVVFAVEQVTSDFDENPDELWVFMEDTATLASTFYSKRVYANLSSKLIVYTELLTSDFDANLDELLVAELGEANLSSTIYIVSKGSKDLSSTFRTNIGIADLSSTFKTPYAALPSTIYILKWYAYHKALSSKFYTAITKTSSKDLSSTFAIGRKAAVELPSLFVVGRGEVDLSATLYVGFYAEEELSSTFFVYRISSRELTSVFFVGFEVKGLSSRFVIQRAATKNLSSKFLVQLKFAGLSSTFTVRQSDYAQLSSKIIIGLPGSKALSSTLVTVNKGIGELSSSFYLPYYDYATLFSTLEVTPIERIKMPMYLVPNHWAG